MKPSPTERDDGSIVRIIGVYDADGTIIGELSYLLRRRVGRAHCALCDITHGRVRERPDWRARRARLPVPFVTFHRDDQPVAVSDAGGQTPPVVLAETAGGALIGLLAGDALERCAGSPERLLEAIEAAAHTHGLRWSAPAI